MANSSDGSDITVNQSAGETDWQDVLLTWLTLPNIIALAVIIGYVYFLIKMLGMTAVEDENIWTRAAYLLTGYEAITFAAAGYIFGKEVHRQQAQAAEKRAEKAQEEKEIAKAGENEVVAKGYRLAEAVKASARASSSSEGGLVPKGLEPTEDDSDYLVNLARELFP